ncbi:MAG: phage holin family protein [Chloroflexi bacterium]|nr:phage holin family protein [Chloroflexota bacterium]
MSRLLIRFILNAAGLFLASQLGLFRIADPISLLIIALIFGVVNSLVRPILAGLTCLINVLTLGLFTFVLNALMLLLTAWIASLFSISFVITGNNDLQRFISALLGAIVISVFSFVLSFFIHENRRR